jgi:hypothetical protein
VSAPGPIPPGLPYVRHEEEHAEFLHKKPIFPPERDHPAGRPSPSKMGRELIGEGRALGCRSALVPGMPKTRAATGEVRTNALNER